MASIETILGNLKAFGASIYEKAKAVIPPFEKSASQELSAIEAEIVKYAGPIGLVWLNIAKQVTLANLQLWATQNLPVLEAEIQAGLVALHGTGVVAGASASSMAASTMAAIVEAATAILAVPK
ncbi:MAG: hypothetical protein KGL39_32430 [Patescibacteria group bacterium]|nr:hypothetical protein [Patescibacteria group bacterium]